jgi:hypothetical protein
VYCGWLGFELCFVLRYVIETKGKHLVLEAHRAHLTAITGRTLEETATIFDGANEELELQQVGTVAATQSINALREEGILSTSTHRLTYPPSLEKSDPSQKTLGVRPLSRIKTSGSTESDVPVRV